MRKDVQEINLLNKGDTDRTSMKIERINKGDAMLVLVA
jgi:hypothetical protein